MTDEPEAPKWPTPADVAAAMTRIAVAFKDNQWLDFEAEICALLTAFEKAE